MECEKLTGPLHSVTRHTQFFLSPFTHKNHRFGGGFVVCRRFLDYSCTQLNFSLIVQASNATVVIAASHSCYLRLVGFAALAGHTSSYAPAGKGCGEWKKPRLSEETGPVQNHPRSGLTGAAWLPLFTFCPPSLGGLRGTLSPGRMANSLAGGVQRAMAQRAKFPTTRVPPTGAAIASRRSLVPTGAA
jgi:hypothetical protein